MESLLESLKPQLDAMNQMYKNGFDEGRRSAFREIAADLQNLQNNFNHTRELPLINQQGETTHEPTQSHQA